MTEPDRLAFLSLAALPLLGCEPDEPDCRDELDAVELPGELPDNGGNPTLLEARWLATDVLELQFSEPLEALSPVDPISTTRFKVMGWNVSTTVYGGYGNDDCTIYTRYYPIRQTTGATVSDLWQAPEDAAVLRLRMSAPVSCATPDDPLTGLALFYVNDPLDLGGGVTSSASVRDTAGNQLPDIGPAWAITTMRDCAVYYLSSPGYYYYYYNQGCNGLRSTVTGSFPVLSSMLSIPCP
ncbi:hypothetical protein ACNOYE_16580 [Nannocystaceae bacterium ST9]